MRDGSRMSTADLDFSPEFGGVFLHTLLTSLRDGPQPLADSLLLSVLTLAKGMAVYLSNPARDLGRVQDTFFPSPSAR